MKTLEVFKTENLDTIELFNTKTKNIFGGDTTTIAQTTATTGNDADTATSDYDQDPNPIEEIFM